MVVVAPGVVESSVFASASSFSSSLLCVLSVVSGVVSGVVVVFILTVGDSALLLFVLLSV